jgi:hypothetical protein
MGQSRFCNMLGINVRVAPVEPEIAKEGLDRDQIKLAVEKTLAGAGLPVIQHFGEEQTLEFPCLGVVLYVIRPQEDPARYIFSVEMFFLQRITLAGPPATEAMRLAWCREATGDIARTAQGCNWASLYKALEFLAGCFIVEVFPSLASVCQPTEAQVPFLS